MGYFLYKNETFRLIDTFRSINRSVPNHRADDALNCHAESLRRRQRFPYEVVRAESGVPDSVDMQLSLDALELRMQVGLTSLPSPTSFMALLPFLADDDQRLGRIGGKPVFV